LLGCVFKISVYALAAFRYFASEDVGVDEKQVAFENPAGACGEMEFQLYAGFAEKLPRRQQRAVERPGIWVFVVCRYVYPQAHLPPSVAKDRPPC
jgi:hypothetical protein